MTSFFIQYLEWAVQYAAVWGFLFVFVFMTIESSFIPFPSELVMIPAGFLAYRGALLFASPLSDLLAVIFFGTAGSILGAYINYFLFLRLGRPLLYRYGNYFFLPPKSISRAEEIFNEYGDISTFVCRLLPGIRQIISIPAGLSRMPLARFTLFTSLGAGIWSAVLALMGYYFASLASNLSYAELVLRGKEQLHAYLPWLALGLSALVLIYAALHRRIMRP